MNTKNKRNTKKEKHKNNKGFPYKSRVDKLKEELRTAELVARIKGKK